MKTQLLLSCGLALGVIAALFLATGSALAQGDPGTINENHYKVYEIPTVPPITVSGPIGLRDQFGVSTAVDEITLEKFGIPVEKHLVDTTGEVFPILDPFRHHTWWTYVTPEPVRRVDVLDQFGGFSWRLRDSRYLLAPAGKNQADVPEGNHYKCYEADDAPFINITVGLKDQVDSVGVVVLYGEYFCNPAAKTVAGVTYPIADSTAHLACYRVENTTPYDITESVVDQFGNRPINLQQNTYLCVPAAKETVVGTEPATWGRIKSLYHR